MAAADGEIPLVAPEAQQSGACRRGNNASWVAPHDL